MGKSIKGVVESKHEGVASVGIDLGDRSSEYVVLGPTGRPIERGKVATRAVDLQGLLGALPATVVAIEVGTHSPWVSRLIEASGHRAIVANGRKVALISGNKRKNNRIDAELLGRLARVDAALLFPIHHRSEAAQRDLAILRAREAAVRTRTRLINHVRGASKSIGKQLNRCSAEAFAGRCLNELPPVLVEALRPIVEQIARLVKVIRAYDRQIETMAERYRDASKLRQVKGVGALTAMAFLLTIDNAGRFSRSRSVGAYLGLVPGTDDTGDTHVQKRITREGDVFLRRLMVSSAHYVMGPFGEDCDLRRHGMGIAERGGKNAKKRAVVAVARKLAVLLHRLWTSGASYEPLYNAQQRQQDAA